MGLVGTPPDTSEDCEGARDVCFGGVPLMRLSNLSMADAAEGDATVAVGVMPPLATVAVGEPGTLAGAG